MRGIWIAGLAAAAAGCRYQGNVVPMAGSPAEVAALAGDWMGEYSSGETHRSGNITFRITARGDSAFGDVQMYIPGAATVMLPTDRPDVHLHHAQSAEFLAIRFVSIGGGQVSGELEPYISPDCECQVLTTFTGAARGDEIRGTYVTRGEWSRVWRGEWLVRRVKP